MHGVNQAKAISGDGVAALSHSSKGLIGLLPIEDDAHLIEANMNHNEPLPPDPRLDLICTISDSDIGVTAPLETAAPSDDSCVEPRLTVLDIQVGVGLIPLVDSH